MHLIHDDGRGYRVWEEVEFDESAYPIDYCEEPDPNDPEMLVNKYEYLLRRGTDEWGDPLTEEHEAMMRRWLEEARARLKAKTK